MKRHMGLLAVMALATGCSDAFLVRPVYYKEGLQERVVDERDGAWVWEKVLVLDMDGLIMAVREPGLFATGENPVSLLKEKLQLAEADPYVRAIVFRINSPGGTITASDIVYRELKAFRERTGRPVIALLMDVAASGGYYVACAADRIIAHPTTLTGSVGVLMQWINFRGLMDFLQLRVETIKSGDKKDMASPFRHMTADEQKILQDIVDRYHAQFVQVVADSRPGLSADDVRKLADGRVLDAHRALELGLVDKLGYMDDAVLEAKKLAEITRAKVVTYSRQFEPRATVYAHSSAPPGQVNLVNFDLGSLARLEQPRLMYLWAPGVRKSR